MLTVKQIVISFSRLQIYKKSATWQNLHQEKATNAYNPNIFQLHNGKIRGC